MEVCMDRKTVSGFIGLFLLISQSAFPSEEEVSYDFARVTRVKPIYQMVQVNNPKEECWSEEVPTYRSGNGGEVAGATLFGGLVGGILGSHIGRGSSRVATGLIGSMAGAAIGHGIASSSRGYDGVTPVRRCRIVDQPETEERIVGYMVDYEYRGEMYRTQMDHRPDEKIRVRISIDPVE
jgi:uncharacterized protein YcfJ